MLNFYLPVEVHCFLISFLCRIIDIACCIAMVLMSMKVCLIVSIGILSFSSKKFIEGVSVVALAPAVMTTSGSSIGDVIYKWLVFFSLTSYGLW